MALSGSIRTKRVGEVEIPVIGQGATGSGTRETATEDSIRTRIRTLREGVELGMTWIDTAESYERGHSEEVLGRALEGIRDKIFLSSKFSPQHNSSVELEGALNGSLVRLKTDYIDLYQMHWPTPGVPLAETMERLLGFRKDGKIRYIGVSNCCVSELEEAVAALKAESGHRLGSLQSEYNLYNRYAEQELLPFCEQNGILLIAYSPFHQGNFRVKSQHQSLLATLGEKYGVTSQQLVLAWLVSHGPVVTVTNSLNSSHIKDNAAVADVALDPVDLARLSDEFARPIRKIPTSHIAVVDSDADSGHPIYTTLEEALANPAGIEPSPEALSEEIKRGKFLKPVEVVRVENSTGDERFQLIHGRVRYWGWVIAYGGEPIPAYVIE